MIRYSREEGRPLPVPNPTTQPFFDAGAEGRFVMQKCPRDGFFFYPRSHCPTCLGDDWEWATPCGRGSVHAFTVDRVGHDPSLAPRAPFAIAIVELEEGPRKTGNVLGCAIEEVQVGLPVEIAFEQVDGVALMHFRPRS